MVVPCGRTGWASPLGKCGRVEESPGSRRFIRKTGIAADPPVALKNGDDAIKLRLLFYHIGEKSIAAMTAKASSVPRTATRIMRIQSANAEVSASGANTLIAIYRS
jgi:hypothetical protein